MTSTLGYPLFEKIKKPTIKNILFCTGKDGNGQGEYTSSGFIVFAGSKCNFSESNGAPEWITNLRKKLLKDGILQVDGKVLVFTSDYIFNSPSSAAVTILGRAANGWTSWKFKDGRTLDEVIRQNIIK